MEFPLEIFYVADEGRCLDGVVTLSDRLRALAGCLRARSLMALVLEQMVRSSAEGMVPN